MSDETMTAVPNGADRQYAKPPQGAHTPGPWTVDSTGSPRVIACDELGSFPICDIRGWGHLTGKGHGALGLSHDLACAIQDANAHLIAAAPDLLRVCESVLWGYCDTNDINSLREFFEFAQRQARTAIGNAKALRTEDQSTLPQRE